MGLGALGGRVAQAVRAFDFPLVGWSRTPHAIAGVTEDDFYDGLHC